MLITADQLRQLVPAQAPSRCEKLAGIMENIFPAYGITSADILEEFLATVLHESGGFRIMEESLYYVTPELLVNNWPKHFTIEQARQYLRNPQKLARYIYGETSIAKDLGNLEPEDGWTFHGRGFIQLTGRYAFTKYAEWAKLESPEQAVELVGTDDYYALDSACWEYCIEKKLIQASIDDNFVLVTKKINGGLIGWDQRQLWYHKVKNVLGTNN